MVQFELNVPAPQTKPLPGVATGNPPATLADVLARLAQDGDLSVRRRRDIASALNTILRAADRRPDAVPATAAALREIFAQTLPANAGVTLRRWANLRSLALAGLAETGVPGIRRQHAASLSAAWAGLRDALPDMAFKTGLSRFMRHCSVANIPPDQVSEAVFAEFGTTIRTGTLVKDPQKVLRTTARLWNRAAAEIDGWPRLVLPVELRPRQYAFEWSEFPLSFQADAAAFLAEKGNEDPFADDYAPAVKPSTTAMRRKEIAQMATALVLSGFDLGALTGLATLVEPVNAKQLLRHLYERHGGRSVYLQQQANLLRTIARHWVHAPPDTIDTLTDLVAKLVVKRTSMTEKNRARLRQFDNRANLLALVALPERVLAECRGKPADRPAALRMMCAVAVNLLTVAPMRINNLAGLEVDRHFVTTRRGKSTKTHLVIPPEETKTGVPFELELPVPTERLLARYRREFLPQLSDTPSPFLFPRESGERRQTGSFAVLLGRFIKRETGL
ncbi:MAG: hypothetical protein P4M00_17005, partial [Azospirillaceae bacterium]|nr:hypothetical protein [Azospirillaceae bacterium]